MAVPLPTASVPQQQNLEPADDHAFLLEVMRSIDRANARAAALQPQPAESERER